MSWNAMPRPRWSDPLAKTSRPFRVMVQCPELPTGMQNYRQRVSTTTMRSAINLALDILFAKTNSPIRQRVNIMNITVERLGAG